MLDLSRLNPEQREAVTAAGGPLLVVAGPGSGKTAVIAARVAYLIDQGLAEPSEVLAVTFTNKAGRELKRRLASVLGEQAQDVWAGTFHAFALRVLRQWGGHFGFDPDHFSVYGDEEDRRAALNQALADLGLDPKGQPRQALLESIGRAKDRLLWPEDVRANDPELAEIYAAYQEALRRRNALDTPFLSASRFPAIRTLEAFDFSFQPDLPAPLIKELARLEFLERAENVILVGPPGTGKTHLASALALKACQARKRVLFAYVPTLLDQLVAATVDRSVGRRLRDLGKLDLLVADELGYLPVDPQRASLFFQLVGHRYERGSIIVTTNKPFDQWGQIFGGDDVMAAAILDRLLHHCHIIVTHGPSYRMKDKLRYARLEEPQEAATM